MTPGKTVRMVNVLAREGEIAAFVMVFYISEFKSRNGVASFHFHSNGIDGKTYQSRTGVYEKNPTLQICWTRT